MLDDVGTSCATTNATPETSFAPRHGVDAPLACTGNRPVAVLWRIRKHRRRGRTRRSTPCQELAGFLWSTVGILAFSGSVFGCSVFSGSVLSDFVFSGRAGAAPRAGGW
jgi:hypothetical protein